MPTRGESPDANTNGFRASFWAGGLGGYTSGTFVAYNKGVLCGQSADRDLLLEAAQQEHGARVAVFKVPNSEVDIGDPSLDAACGYFSP